MDIKYYSVVPAYGRDYKTLDEVKAAWEAGSDFKISSVDSNDGRYINKEGAQDAALKIQIRYNQLQDIYIWPEPSTE